MSFGRQASWAKMTSPGGKLTALACHRAKKVNKAEELTYLSTKHCLKTVGHCDCKLYTHSECKDSLPGHCTCKRILLKLKISQGLIARVF
jgi:hypothetical protein